MMIQEETVVRPYELRAQTAKALLKRLYRELAALISEEVELAKVEFRERADVAAEGIRGLAFATACAIVAVASFAACAVAALAYAVPLWLAAFIVGAILFAVAAAVAAGSRRRLSAAAEPMRSTVGTFLNRAHGDATPDERRARIEATREAMGRTVDALEQKTDLIAPMRDTALGLGSLGVAVSSIVRSERASRT